MDKNDVTGDKLISKTSNDKFREGFDLVFGKKLTIRTVVYWVDGTWCDLDEVGQYTHLSDDFSYLDLPWDMSDAEVEHAVSAACGGHR